VEAEQRVQDLIARSSFGTATATMQRRWFAGPRQENTST
jgi:hypothetical protein